MVRKHIGKRTELGNMLVGGQGWEHIGKRTELGNMLVNGRVG